MAETLSPAEIARAAFYALSSRDPGAAVKYSREDSVDDIVAIGKYRGPDQIHRFLEELFGAFPDFTMNVDRIVADDTTAVVQWHAPGTFI